MQISEEIRKEFVNALINSSFGNYEAVKNFKARYPSEYKIINGSYQKRVKINKSIQAMKLLGDVFWFTLTFKDAKDKNAIASKRKEGFIFLNEVFSVFLVVEEFGEDNGRYHLHGFGVFKLGKSFDDFRRWHSRQNIKLLTSSKQEKSKIRYLTNYATKTCPRIRKNKNLVRFEEDIKRANKWLPRFPSMYEKEKNEALLNLNLNIYAIELPF